MQDTGHFLADFRGEPVPPFLVCLLMRTKRGVSLVQAGDIQKPILVKLPHRASQDGVDATIGLPASPSAIDAGVVDLGATLAILVDRQFLPLASQIELLQNIVEDLEQTQLQCRATAADRKMRQDKLLVL